MLPKPSNQRGGVIVLVAASMFVLLGFTALAVDVGHLVVARNELQNAADAGALAGAQELYTPDGTAIKIEANQVGFAAARANHSEKVPVDVNWTDGDNVGSDVERGHWSFGWGASPRGFYPSDSTIVIDLPGRTDEELDAMDGVTVGDVFVNAVRVVARRQQAAGGTPLLSFFARIFGYESFELSAEAVAYRGFAGKLLPGDVDLPIAICEESVPHGDCNIGRFINSGQAVESSETGGWTDFNQEGACQGGTNANAVTSLVECNGGVNDVVINGGEAMATNGGDIQSAFNTLINTWKNCATNPVFDEDGNEIGRTPIDIIDADGNPGSDGVPDVPWCTTLPLISCPGNNVGVCSIVTGAVKVCIVWITGAGDDPHFSNAPDHMDDWVCDETLWDPVETTDLGEECWDQFVSHFNLQNVPGSVPPGAPYEKKSIYFKPDCTPQDLAGVSGGHNYGVLAKIPVLVD